MGEKSGGWKGTKDYFKKNNSDFVIAFEIDHNTIKNKY
jgi:hypothetical protein